MIRSLLPYLISAMLGVLLRDLQVWCASKIFCWRRRRQAKREAAQTAELRALAVQFAAAEEDKRKKARMTKLMAAIPYPRELKGPWMVKVSNDREYLQIVRAIHGNCLALGKRIVEANFEEN